MKRNDRSLIAQLRTKIEKLKEAVSVLKRKLNEISHPNFLAGIKGEDLIVKLLQGKKSSGNASYDLLLKNGAQVEVKYSKLNQPMKNASPASFRWTWHSLLSGNVRAKKYSYIILIGENNGPYRINNDRANYTYFFLTRRQINNIVDKNSKRGHLNFFPKPRRKVNPRREQLLAYRKTQTEMKQICRDIGKVK